jgi:hypothetical protein|tara:strand:+ start:7815 stop:8171 length:357 start_codon:yes stop_codon:yes gene_type:complete
MTEEGLNASILRLQSFVIETYGMIKDIYRREQQEGDVDKVAQLSMKLAQYEGALLTLRGYKQDIIDSAAVEEEPEEEPEEEQIPEEKNEGFITEEYLEKESKTFRNSQAHQKKKKGKK